MEKKFLEAIEAKSDLNELFSNFDLKDLIKWSEENEFTEGIAWTGYTDGNIDASFEWARVTRKGKKLLEEIENPQEKNINVNITNPEMKEISEYLSLLNERQKKFLKLLVDKNEILNEILSLKSDEINLMKIELEKIQKKEDFKSLPWDAINGVLSIGSTLASLTQQYMKS